MKKLKGFTLIEVLVTLIIMSVGILGIANLQLRSLQYTQSGYQRTLASIQAQDLAERLWSTLKEVNLESTNPNTWSEYVSWKDDWKVGNNKDNATLPAWSGTIATPTTAEANNRIYTITIAWNDPRFGGASSFQYQLRLLKVQ